MCFANWLDVFLSEKGIDLEWIITVEGESGPNLIPVGCLVEAMKSAPDHEQRGIKAMMVRIDYRNGNVMDYLRHLAKAIAL